MRTGCAWAKVCTGVRTLLVAIIAPFCSGCLAGSLATNTGALPGETWSIAARQAAHVGEVVQLSFVLKKPFESKSMHALGLADYCVFNIAGERYDVDLNADGSFTMEFPLDRAQPGDSMPITASAYRQYDGRDHMRIANQWMTNESPNNGADQWVASGGVTLEVYQSRIELLVPALPDGLDLGTAQLVLRRRDGDDAVVYPDHPPRRGFTVEPVAEGGWRIDYLPRAAEVNPTGMTPAVLTFQDRAGNRHEYRTDVPTP